MAKHDDGKGPETAGASAGAPGRTVDRQRVAKLMARAGLCSRRDAETWVTAGRVTLNGAVLSSPAVDVGPGDTVLVDGVPLPDAEKTRLFLFHKPRGLVTSDHDPEGRPTVADHLRAAWPEGPRVVTVGRLDINTEGLLLLTNDGGLARVLELPQTGWVRRYRVRAKGQTDQGVLDGLREGVTIDGVDYAGIEARLDRAQGSNCWLTMGLREGKNREVKRVLEHVGLEVNRLIRLSFGPFQLGDLTEGAVSEVKTRILRDQLGEALAAQAGVDFHDVDEPGAPAPSVERPASRSVGGATRAGARGAAPGRGSDAPRRVPRPPASSSRPGGGRQDGRGSEASPAKRERPATGPRKHVSLLRSGHTTEGPRKRVERTNTRDSADREVAVERVETVRAAPSRAGAARSAVARSGNPKPGDPKLGTSRPGTSRPGASKPGTFKPGTSRPSKSKSGAARVRAFDEARHEGDRAPHRGGAARQGASPSAVGKRERVKRSGGAPDARGGARDDRSDQKRPRGGGLRRTVERDATPGRLVADHRPARADAAGRAGGRRERPGGGEGARPSAGPSAREPFRDGGRSVTRERQGRPPRTNPADRGPSRRADAKRSAGGAGEDRTPRAGNGPAVAKRPARTGAPGTGPRGRPSGGKPDGDKPNRGGPNGGKGGGGKRGGGRPVDRPKR